MLRTRARVAAVAALLVLMMAMPGGAGAGTRIPVNSVDDAASPAANRIAAVTNIVSATNARLGRVITAYPPNPCADVTEPTPLCDAALGAVIAYSVLGESVADACLGVQLDGPGDTVITDADAYAADMSTIGVANQLASIATVLANADDRLGGIRLRDPGTPESPEAAALNTLYDTVLEGGSMATRWLGGSEWPPNPCTPIDG